MAPTASSKARGYACGKPESWIIRRDSIPPREAEAAVASAAAKAKRAEATLKRGQEEPIPSESFPDFHPAAGCDVADDGGCGAGRIRRFPATAGLGAASGGLPHHADPDVLPRREPRGCDVFDHGATRKTIRTSARADADDVDQLFWQLADHAPVFTGPQHR